MMLRLFLLIFIINIPFAIANSLYNLNRPLVTYESIICVLIIALNKRIGVFIVLMCWVLDFINFISFNYHFDSHMELLSSIKFIQHLNIIESIYLLPSYLIAFLVFIACIYLIVNIKYQEKYISNFRRIIIIASGLIVADVINGGSELIRRDNVFISVNIVGSPTYGLMQQFKNRNNEKNKEFKIVSELVNKNNNILKWLTENSNHSVLYIIIESFGVPQSKGIYDLLKNTLLMDNYNVTYEEVFSKGSTVYGEIRLLCGIHISYRYVHEVSKLDCLPSALDKLGWRTYGLHGFSKNMFNREDWWSSLGLKIKIFAESDELKLLDHCGTIFRGVCDDVMIDLAVSKINSSEKTFSYLLTLNTHLPVSNSKISDSFWNICKDNNVADNSCKHLYNINKVLQKIAASVSVVKKNNRPLVIIAGDHPPPFVNLSDLESFKKSYVPYIILYPEK